jgi:hypothetical protein
MTKTPSLRLKVFKAPFGFYDTIVAVPSRAAALRAWGTRQDLFAWGQAHEVYDRETVAMALAHPGEVLKRAVGSNEPFAVEPTSLPNVPAASARPKLKTIPKPKPKPEKARPPANRTALTRAEASLAAVDTARKAEEATFREQQDALDKARSASQATYVARRKDATAKVVEARGVYRKAGGVD